MPVVRGTRMNGKKKKKKRTPRRDVRRNGRPRERRFVSAENLGNAAVGSCALEFLSRPLFLISLFFFSRVPFLLRLSFLVASFHREPEGQPCSTGRPSSQGLLAVLPQFRRFQTFFVCLCIIIARVD